LKWAHENGCDWGKETIIAAYNKKNVDCLYYAYKNNCPLPDTTIVGSVSEEDILSLLKKWNFL
jgi:hypothetical protein